MKDCINLLDCTLRDGGYYNNWDFSQITVSKYLRSIEKSGIRVIELGFRQFPQKKFLGAFAYTTDEFIESLDISKSIDIAVMVDASTILSRPGNVKDNVNLLFREKNKSKVKIVRIASHINQINESEEIALSINKLGYKVFLNIMQPNTVKLEALKSISQKIKSWNTVDVIYFADSFGNLTPGEVQEMIAQNKNLWNRQLGFHAHNNKGLALTNSIMSIDTGGLWVDSTIMGMGRGAGNAHTENLLLDLVHKYGCSFNPEELFDLVLNEFTLLKEKYKWGQNLAYHLSAINNIHPTYIQEMLSNNRYSNLELLNAVKFMSNIDARQFKKDLLLKARGEILNPGSWDAHNWCKNKEILILGSGKSLSHHKDGIIKYIQLYKPLVVSLNLKDDFEEKFIDLFVSSNETRMLEDFKKYEYLKKPLAVSLKLLKKTIGKDLKNKNILDYGLNVKSGVFKVEKTGCTLPTELAIGYALAIVLIGNASKINLVGFDGYDDQDDIRQLKMNELLELFYQSSGVELTSLTPTTYNVKEGSIYAIKS